MNAALEELSNEIVEQLMIKGDISGLNQEQIIEYYRYQCFRNGLDPASKPFDVITLQGKKVLYPTKGCCEQLRKIHGISVIDTTIDKINNEYVCTCKVKSVDGRTDIDVGAIPATDHNSLMKAITKAKRRATLSICGLGDVDEAHPAEYTIQSELQQPRSQILLEDESSAKKLFVDICISKVEADKIPSPILANLCITAKHLADTQSIENAARWVQKNAKIEFDYNDDGQITNARIKDNHNDEPTEGHDRSAVPESQEGEQ